MKRLFILSLLGWAGAAALLADFSYRETTRMTMTMGGAASGPMGEAMVSRVSVKGARLALANRAHISITDLDKRTVTEINLLNKTYSIKTFERMRQQREQLAQRMSRQKGANPAGGAQPKIKVSSKETGRTRTISGLATKEYIVSTSLKGTGQSAGGAGSMAFQSSVWMAKDVPGYEEVRAFYVRMAKSGGFSPGQPGGQGRGPMNGIVDLSDRLAAMEGVPVLTVMVTSMGGMVPAGHAGAPGMHMEATTEASEFSKAPIDESTFKIPAGFQRMDPDMGPRGVR